MTRPRSLADELAELVNPAPQAELDPEAAGISEGDALGGSDDELAGLVGQAARGRRAIAADIALEGAEYQGRRSSRAALFGADEQQQQGSSSEEDPDADGDSDDEQQQLGGVRMARHVQGALPPGRRDLSTIPTMFANGHMNGPGRDDPTSSSSLFSDEGEEEGQETQQQQQQQAEAAAVPTQQPAAAAAVARVQEQQLQQREELRQNGNEDGASEDEGGRSEQDDQADQQQLLKESDGGSSSVMCESEEGSQEEDSAADKAAAGSDEEGSADSEDDAGEDEESDDGGDEQVLGGNGLGVDAAAAGVTAMLGDDEEMQQLEREAAAAQAEAAQQLVAASARSSRDAEKAAGVRAQQRLWGAALELRIRLQKALAGGNSLPRPAARASLAAHSQQVARGYCDLLGSCQSTLQDMLTLHHTLAQQHPAAAAALAAAESAQQQQQQQQPGKGKRSRAAAGLDADDEQQQQQQPAAVKYAGACRNADEAWSTVEAAIANLAGFRDASLDKWHRRTVLSSGTAALRGSSGLRALQQSVSSQVAALMADKAKLVARSQLPVELTPRPLGTPAAAAAQAGGSEHEGNADGGRSSAGDGDGRRERARDAETYDEGDFYQQLLKELLESAPPGSLPQQLAGARPPKRRKLVDRRASKGRKIRYHTMDKLVGFMAPAELVAPPFAEQLFANLFSHQR